MPSSKYIMIPSVLFAVKQLQPKSICDIGIGCGKYGLLFREILDLNEEMTGDDDAALFRGKLRLDGVEVYPNYITDVQKAIYDHIHIADICEQANDLPEYDLFVMIDVLEHIKLDQGLRLLDALRRKSRIGVLVVTPIQPMEHGASMGNEHEAHISVWGKKQWTSIERTRYTITSGKWLALVQGKNSVNADWLRIPRFHRRCKLALQKTIASIFPGREITLDF